MAGYLCTYCNHTMPLIESTYKKELAHFSKAYIPGTISPEDVHVVFYRCPNCSEISIELHGYGQLTSGLYIPVRPSSNAWQLPNYVPESIRNDYTEAYSIVHLSPKASATLSRRCIQGMIRDFWGVSKPTLNKEIQALKDIIPSSQWDVLNNIRRIGNIGAHPEKSVDEIIDIEPENAEKLLKVIEYLIKLWYVDRKEREDLFSDVSIIDDIIQEQRDSGR